MVVTSVQTTVRSSGNIHLLFYIVGARVPYFPWSGTCNKNSLLNQFSNFNMHVYHAVDKSMHFLMQKSPKMLGWSGGTFITLETFAFVFNLVLLSPMGGAYDEYGLRNFGFSVDVFQILLSLLFLGCMAGYCVVIILYILKLREDDTGSEYTYGEFDDAGTIPAPPATTNLSRSSTAHSGYSTAHNNKSSGIQTPTASQGHVTQCNNQHHATSGHNHQGHKSSPLLQDRRLNRVNHVSQDRLNDTAGTVPGHYFLPNQHGANPYAGVERTLYANFAHPNRWSGEANRGIMTCRQSQTLPHPNHFQRHSHAPHTFAGGVQSGTTGTQFPSRSRVDLATLTQTLTRNHTPNVKRAPHGSILQNVNTVPNTTPGAITVDSAFEGESWEQPRVQALKYNYASRKGASGGTTNHGVQV